MDVKVALVKAQRGYWLDRRIAEMRGGQEFSHAALVVTRTDQEPMWLDVHWRWFISDLRNIPARNYAWEYRLFPLRDMNIVRTTKVIRWLSAQEAGWTRYDVIGALCLYLGISGPSSPRSFTCFEFVTRALLAAGYDLDFDSETALASDLLSSGVLLPAIG